MELPVGTLDLEREVLNDCGNMSAPTVLVRPRTADRARLAGTHLADCLRARTSPAPPCCWSGHDLAGHRGAGLRHVAASWSSSSCPSATPSGCWRAGAHEVAPDHYPLIVALHAAWLGALWFLGPGPPIEVLPLILFLLLQIGRVWVISTLGERWTTRIIILPGEPLVKSGPYRWVDHPNYLDCCRRDCRPAAGVRPADGLAILFSMLNAAILWVRIREENQALGR